MKREPAGPNAETVRGWQRGCRQQRCQGTEVETLRWEEILYAYEEECQRIEPARTYCHPPRCLGNRREGTQMSTPALGSAVVQEGEISGGSRQHGHRVRTCTEVESSRGSPRQDKQHSGRDARE